MDISVISILVLLSIALTFVCGVWIIYRKTHGERYTREKYAFSCLTAVVALVTMLASALFSKEGLADHFLTLVAIVTGNPKPIAAPPSPIEEVLLTLVVAFTIYFILQSHKNWEGLVTVDEVERKRLHRSTTFISQGVGEGLRLLTGKSEPTVAQSEKRIKGDIPYPSEPQIVWHEYARQLFELWYSKSPFDLLDESSWDPPMRCWRGFDKAENRIVFLFCPQEAPEVSWANSIQNYVNNIANGHLYKVFLVYREYDHLQGVSEKVTYVPLSLEYLLDKLVDFTDYYNEIRRRVEKVRFPESNTTIKDIYAPSGLATLDGKPISDDMGGYLGEWARHPPGRQIAILGEYGQGKSTGALMFVYDAIESNLAKSGNRIPILFELRGKSPSNLLPNELMGTWAQQYKLHADALMKLLVAGRLILIFEGFDEMANVANVEARLSHFRSLWQFAYPNSKIAFTGRPNLFFEDRELEIVFKTAEGSGTAATCQVFRLVPFSIEKIEHSLRWTDKDSRGEIIAAAKSSTQILDIVARPSLLYIVTALWDELRPLLSAGKVMSAQVIDRFIGHSYKRQADKEFESSFMILTTTERRYFHEGIAVYMASTGATNQIVKAEIEAVVRRLYASYPDNSHVLDDVKMESSRQPLKRRFADPEDAIEAIATDVRTHGILVDDPARPGTFRFAHKSFYELLYAKSYACISLDVEPSFYKAIQNAMEGDIGEISRSGQIIRFFAEVLNDKFPNENNKFSLGILALMLGIQKKNKFAKSLVRKTAIMYTKFRFGTVSNRLMFFVMGALTAVVAASIGVIFGKQLAPLGDVSNVSQLWSRVIEHSGIVPVLVVLATEMIFVTIVVTYSEKFRQATVLWAAILLALDDALGINEGQSEVTYLIGSSADQLLKAARIKLDTP